MTANVKIATALTDEGAQSINKRIKQVGISHSINAPGATLTWNTETENSSQLINYVFAKPIQWVSVAGAVNWTNVNGLQVIFIASGYFFYPQDVAGTGIFIGGTLTGAVNGLVVNGFTLGYWPTTPMRSNPLSA